jgi:primosomal protein N' (replication factor Y)
MNNLWQVCLTSPPYSFYTYIEPEFFPVLLPGQRVLVPLGKSIRVAFLVEKTTEAPQNIQLRKLIWPLEKSPMLDDSYFSMCRNIAARQLMPLGKVLENVIPTRFRSAGISFKVADRAFPATLKAAAIRDLSASMLPDLVAAFNEGRMKVRLPASKEKEEYVSLTQDPPWPVRPNAARQIQLLEYIYENGPRDKSFLRNVLGSWINQTVSKLHADSLVKVGPPPESEKEAVEACTSASAEIDLVPTQCQLDSIKNMEKVLDGGEGGVRLLHGITGSGKTLVYLSLARKCLEQGRSVILLVPEIALAYSLWNTVCRHFSSCRKYLYHGYQTPVRREAVFRELAEDKSPALIIGTRSALFLPVHNPGMIVLDEEHDESFKQEERLPYQAKEIAFFLASRAKALLILGSATPDVKTFYASTLGAIETVSMDCRVGESVLPEVRVVDISAIKNPEQPLAPETVEKLLEVLEKGEQAVIMLNRRGYSPLMYCVDCEEPFRCPHCNVSMTYHRGRERLVCHYCGTSFPFPVACSTCGGMNYLPLGGGTERLEEQIAKIVPKGIKILRMDRDSTRRQEVLEDILKRFAAGEAQVLVGTQMLSKGHNFPGVTLVIVSEGDLGLNLPDYRSAERTFQLLVQVSGRAGRGDKPGEVIIQTRNPSNPIWSAVSTADYKTFFEQEIERRRKFRYPPFCKLALIRISHSLDWDNEALLQEYFTMIREAAREKGLMLMGPVPAPLSQLRGRKRYNCLIKADQWLIVRELYSKMMQINPDRNKIRTSLDLDPVNML